MVATLASVARDLLVSTACDLGYYGYAAERTADQAKGLFLQGGLFDTLYNMTPEGADPGARTREISMRKEAIS